MFFPSQIGDAQLVSLLKKFQESSGKKSSVKVIYDNGP